MHTAGCLCGRGFFQEANEGTCLSCGHGDVAVTRVSLEGGLLRLPRDLGAILREGRRMSPGRFQNVRRG